MSIANCNLSSDCTMCGSGLQEATQESDEPYLFVILKGYHAIFINSHIQKIAVIGLLRYYIYNPIDFRIAFPTTGK